MLFRNQAMNMHVTQERNRHEGFGFTLHETTTAANPSRPLPETGETENHGYEADTREFPNANTPKLTASERTWCATLAAERNLPQLLIEEALVLLYHDRLLVENVLNTAAQMGCEPMSIVESILERRG
jgi:hypothetical protein